MREEGQTENEKEKKLCDSVTGGVRILFKKGQTATTTTRLQPSHCGP